MRFFLLWFGSFLLASTSLWGSEVRVVELQHRTATEMKTVAQELLHGRGKALAFEEKLVLQGSAADLASVEEAIRRLDVPSRMVKVTLRQDATQGNAIYSGQTRSVEREETRAKGGLRLGNSQSVREQFLEVLEGEVAIIGVGRQIPFTRAIGVLSGRHVGYSQVNDIREVETAFKVRPRYQGKDVLLEIAPRMTALSPRGMDEIDFHHLATTVRIPVGQWYNLAGHLSRDNEVNRAFLEWRAGERNQELEFWIKVDR